MIPNDLVKVDESGLPRLYYFEGNPTPLTKKDDKGKYPDRSTDYLDDKLGENFLDQLNVPIKKGQVDWFGWMNIFSGHPEYVVFIVLGLAVAYAFIQGGGVI